MKKENAEEKLFSKLLNNDKDLISELTFKKLIDDPNSTIQIEILKIFADSSLKLPEAIIINKIFSPNDEIRAAAIKNFTIILEVHSISTIPASCSH